MSCWLLKTEAGCFSIDDLARSQKQTTSWDGVRNYQARNFIRDAMRIGDPVLFYHSVTSPCIAGLAEVCSTPYPDPTQWDPEATHFDPRSSAEKPLWYTIDILLVQKLKKTIPLTWLRSYTALDGMELLKKGSRLSVQPVTQEQYDVIIALTQTF